MEQLTRKYSLLLIIVVTSGFSCNKESAWDCVKTTGSIEREIRVVDDFTQIQLNQGINLILTQSSAKSLVLEAGKNLLGKITTIVDQGTLVIKNNNSCNWTRSYKKDINIYLNVDQLGTVTHNGYGKITSTNTITSSSWRVDVIGDGDVELDIDATYFYSGIYGSGTLALTGTIGDYGLWVSGNAWVRCETLNADSVFVTSGSSGDSYVKALYKFKGVISNIGNIYYSGNPSDVILEATGSGQFISN
ncbi:MAG TPA: DUF2807 domain-containing protein [Flavobacteriales bacterium]|nr:DUF2807 domain-containing protein [Flavobacteriales bacterium]HIA12840.1 DUF2807 domain-containing protein [Flavobacteriales bacterium]HIO73416.1 DUF2807 domain-containing protein [Flavobacteriales bacterium]